MKITTQDTFIDHQIIETLGIVKGNTIRARHIGKDILAGFRSIVGGEVSEYTKMLAESREQAIDRMIEDAKSKGANGIVGMKWQGILIRLGIDANWVIRFMHMQSPNM